MSTRDAAAVTPADPGVMVWIGPNQTPPAYVEVVSDTEVRARYMGGGQGPERVTVRTPAGEVTAEGAFFAEVPPPPPTITAVEPARGPGGVIVTIRGSGFRP